MALGAVSWPQAQEATEAPEAEEAAEAEAAEGETRVVAVVPAAPDDPVALAAYTALNRNCARCHQEGALKRERPAGKFGNVLELEALAGDVKFVAPGNPDGSPLVQLILNEEMPYDIFQEFDFTHGPPPSPEEVAAIRDWVTSLDQSVACADREPTRLDDIVAAIAADLDEVDRDRVEATRYLTLTHLANACVDEERLNVYRQGAVKALNSLSLSSNVVVLETIDEAGTILRFNLKDMGWRDEDWDTVLAAYPYLALPDTQMAEAIGEITNTYQPFVRADWFSATATKPPLYHLLLDLPNSFQELQEKFDVDVAYNIEEALVDRAGFQDSGVSANNRLIERHAIATGYFWTSYDFAGNRDRQSLFEFPLGPGDAEFDFSHDGGETIFSLPNGFQGYYLNAADGTRLDQGPTAIVRDQSRKDLAVTNGISCIGCHNLGIRKKTDAIRTHVLDSRSFPKRVRDDVEALYPTKEEMDEIMERDAEKFAAAMRAAGLDPNLSYNGIEMTTVLAEQYDDDLDITLAAAEFDLSVEEFIENIQSAGDGEAARLGRRLEQGLVPRDTFEALYPRIVERVADLYRPDIEYIPVPDPKPAPEPVAEEDYEETAAKEDIPKGKPVYVEPAPKQVEIDLALTSDRSAYYKDDLAVFTVTTSADCYLTLLNVDSARIATVLFPNKFDDDNYLRAARVFEFPGADAPFQFRLGTVGRETVIAICSTDDKLADNIALNPDEALTQLGDYEEYITRQIVVEETAPREKKAATSDIARTAIKFDVR